MNSKKISSLTVTLLLSASLLCGCSPETGEVTGSETGSDHSGVSSTENITSSENSSQNAPDNTSPAISAIPETPSEPPKPVDPNTPTIIKSPLGGYILAGEVTKVMVNGEEGTVNDINDDKDNFWTAYTDTAYYRMPKTPNILLEDYSPDDTSYEYSEPGVIPFLKAKAGDKIGDLTVAKAESSFFSYNNTLQRISMELDGELTLTGYVTIIPEDEYGVSKGDIHFMPIGDVPIPIVRFSSVNDDGFPVGSQEPYERYFEGLYVLSEVTSIGLGNTNSTTADISELPTDGSCVKAELTISNISTWCMESYYFITADIVSARLVD